jgi:septation ring formation regulator EzrA
MKMQKIRELKDLVFSENNNRRRESLLGVVNIKELIEVSHKNSASISMIDEQMESIRLDLKNLDTLNENQTFASAQIFN